MPTYPRDTDAVHVIRLPATIRCFWSEILTRNDSDVWMNVEAHIVQDGAALDLTIYRVDAETKKRVETLEQLSGTLSDGRFEQQHRVRLTPEQWDAARGVAVLEFEARIDAYGLTAVSQHLCLVRARYSI